MVLYSFIHVVWLSVLLKLWKKRIQIVCTEKFKSCHHHYHQCQINLSDWGWLCEFLKWYLKEHSSSNNNFRNVRQVRSVGMVVVVVLTIRTWYVKISQYIKILGQSTLPAWKSWNIKMQHYNFDVKLWGLRINYLWFQISVNYTLEMAKGDHTQNLDHDNLGIFFWIFSTPTKEQPQYHLVKRYQVSQQRMPTIWAANYENMVGMISVLRNYMDFREVLKLYDI